MYVTTRQIPSRRGLGAAVCPSLAQLQGVVDPNDPCQQLSPSGDTVVLMAPGTVAAPPTCMAGDQLQLKNGSWLCVPQASGPASMMAGAAGFLQSNPMLAVGIGLAVVFLIAGSGISSRGGRR